MSPSIPDITLAHAMARVHERWDADRAPHHLLAAQSGQGKTTLITRALLPLACQERQLLIDIKGDDPVLTAYPALPVERVRPGFGMDGEGGGPYGRWFRLVLDPSDRESARKRAGEALEIVLDEGNCTLVIDEARRITDQQRPGLGLGSLVESILMSNRSRHVQAILALVSVERAISAARNQWAFAWTGTLKDDKVRRRWLELLGLPNGAARSATDSYLPVFRGLARHEWLYLDQEGAEGMMGILRAGELAPGALRRLEP